MRRKIQESIDDPGTDVDAAAVFKRIERLHAQRYQCRFSPPIAPDEEQFIL